MHRKKRNHRMSKVGTIGVALLVIPAVAVALFIHTLFIQGSFTTGDGAVMYNVPGGVFTSAGTCDGTFLDDQTMDLTWAAPMPGDVCQLYFEVASNGNTTDMRAQSVTLNGGTLTGTLGVSCGVAVPPAGGAEVYLDIELDPAAPTSTLVTWVGGGLDWVPAADYDPLLCDA